MYLLFVLLLTLQHYTCTSFIPTHGIENRRIDVTDLGPLHRYETIHQIIGLNNNKIENPLNKKVNEANSSPIIYITSFGGDPYGINDSTTAFEEAINSALKRGAPNTYLANNITDLGGVTIDLGGGDYLISSPLTIPAMYGNLRIIDGTIRASKQFSPITGYLLSIGDINYNCSYSCNENIGIENIMFDSKNICYGSLHIIKTNGAVIGPQIFVLGYNNAGITITGGGGIMIFNAWLGEYLYSDSRKHSANATSIQLFSNDAYISNTIIFAGKIGVHCKGYTAVIEGVHTWNLMTSDGGIGILVESSGNIRFLHNYLDYNDLVLTTPWNDMSVEDTFFLGGGTMVLRSNQEDSEINGLNFVDSIYSPGKFTGNVSTVMLDESKGKFGKINNLIIKGIQVSNTEHYQIKTTFVKRSLTLINATEWRFDFNDILLFDSIGINDIQYTLQNHVNSKNIFIQHQVKVDTNNKNDNGSRIATVYTNQPCDATVHIQVDQSTHSVYD